MLNRLPLGRRAPDGADPRSQSHLVPSATVDLPDRKVPLMPTTTTNCYPNVQLPTALMSFEEVYMSGEYLAKHPGWHSEVSPQKAQEIMKMIKISGITPTTIGEVGCGAGGILVELQKQMDGSCVFEGYDISPQSIEIAREKENEMLHFKQADFLEQNAYFDLLLMIDMIEHVEDCFSFLRNVKSKGEYKMIQFALDLTVKALLKPDTLLGFRNTDGHVGHVHYFTKNIALAMLEDLGYEIVHHFYTLVPCSPDAPPLSWKARLHRIPRAIFCRLNKDAAVRFIGGYKLLVLAK